MPLPTSNDVHVDGLLTQASIGYTNATYIADEAFPLLPVNKRSNYIAAYNQSPWFRDEAKTVALGTDIPIAEYSVDTSTHSYFCHKMQLGAFVYDEIRDNADSVFNLERDAVQLLTDKLMLRREVHFVTNQFTSSVWDTDVTGGTNFTQWSDYAGSDPLADITGYADTMEGLIAVEPNKILMGKQVYIQLKNHPQLLDTIKYTQKAQLTPDLISSLLERRLLVGRAIYTTSKEGTAEGSVSYSRVWGKHALLLYTPDSPSLMRPSAGYTVVWNRVPGAKQYMQRFRKEEKEADLIVVNSYFQQKRLLTAAGAMLSSAVA